MPRLPPPTHPCGGAKEVALPVLAPVLDVRALRQRGVNRAITIAGHIDRLVDEGLVVPALPIHDESDLDLLEGSRPILVLLAFDLHRKRLERLPELLQQEHGVDPGAAAQRAEQ